ncbi:patatin-like phospholipase family protein [Rosistilla oblonga]|uniref:patatin-like phospholipase family protein n=1 Tax=Rosistilla oblonga TaxID=2527990 RepID=UPI003A9808C5
MYANIVFAGGGVKGAVLGGCLAAAEANDVIPVGFGGTSAGSIIALLASVGYSGEDLEALLVETDLLSFLDDQGRALQKIQRDLELLNKRLNQGFWRSWCYSTKVLSAFRAKRHLPQTIGLYDGEPLIEFLVTKVAQKLNRAEAEVRTATFGQLREMGGKPLRIVATDLNTRRAVLFGDQSSDVPVVLAVRASAGYPMLFKPVHYRGMRLVDGGLSSNLPSFLFEHEYAEDRITTLAFDLILPEAKPEFDRHIDTSAEESGSPQRVGDTAGEDNQPLADLATVAASSNPTPPSRADVGDFFGALLNSGLEASDVLLRHTTAGVAYFPIRTPAGISTLDFHLSKEQRAACFNAGYREANRQLSTHEPIQRTRRVGDELRKQMILQYGPISIYEPILRALVQQIDSACSGELRGLRAQIMLLTGRKSEHSESTRVVLYSIGMDRDNDRGIEIDQDAGCSGFAWQNQRIFVANLDIARANPETWKMTSEQHDLVPPRIKSMISAPIPRSVHNPIVSKTPIGTISVDCETPLADTGWVDGAPAPEIGNEPEKQPVRLNEDVATVMSAWAAVIAAVLP